MTMAIRLGRVVGASAVALLGVFWGCASRSAQKSDAGGAALVTGEFPCEVEHVLVTVCQHCHSSPPQNDAPFPLVAYGDTQVDASGRPIYSYMLAALEAGQMPLPPMQLTSSQRAMLIAWLRAGALSDIPGRTCAPPGADAGKAASAGDGGRAPEVDAATAGDDANDGTCTETGP